MVSENAAVLIVRLSDRGAYCDEVVRWIHEQWGRANGDSRDSIRRMLLESSDCPPSLVAEFNHEPIGVVACKRHLPVTTVKEGS